MKKAFTLVEMLIVVALIATLMTIVFKLSSVGSGESCRNETIVRLEKLENCLSGYYAAYGSYPPVPLHNTRNILEGVNVFGVQNIQGSGDRALSDSELWNWNVKTFLSDEKKAPNSCVRTEYSTQTAEKSAWKQIKAACEAQPVALETPDAEVDGLSAGFKELVEIATSAERALISSSDLDYDKWTAGFGTVDDNPGNHDETATSWREVQLFKFGLMSFLLPRFQTMMGWADDLFAGGGSCRYEQWNANCGDAPRDPMDGTKTSWKDINDDVRKAMGYGKGGGGTSSSKSRVYLEAFPSEAVTARWMPNLEKICACDYPDRVIFGIKLSQSGYSKGIFGAASDRSQQLPLAVYSSDNKLRNCYHLNRISVLDGWGTDFFYYSPSPHQSYQLWSAGKNRRTFPPWVPRKSLESKALQCVTAWTEDDIKGMSN